MNKFKVTFTDIYDKERVETVWAETLMAAVNDVLDRPLTADVEWAAKVSL